MVVVVVVVGIPHLRRRPAGKIERTNQETASPRITDKNENGALCSRSIIPQQQQ